MKERGGPRRFSIDFGVVCSIQEEGLGRGASDPRANREALRSRPSEVAAMLRCALDGQGHYHFQLALGSRHASGNMRKKSLKKRY